MSIPEFLYLARGTLAHNLRRVDTLTEMPERFAAGTTVKLSRSHGEYPASDGWGLKLYLAGSSIANFTGAANGDAFDVTITATSTATFEPGTYRWVERVTKASEVFDVASGPVTIDRNLATAAAGDAQSWEEQTLAVVNAALAGRLEAGMAGYQIAGRSVSFYSLPELLEVKGKLEAAIRRQRRGGRLGRDHAVRFGRTS